MQYTEARALRLRTRIQRTIGFLIVLGGSLASLADLARVF